MVRPVLVYWFGLVRSGDALIQSPFSPTPPPVERDPNPRPPPGSGTWVRHRHEPAGPDAGRTTRCSTSRSGAQKPGASTRSAARLVGSPRRRRHRRTCRCIPRATAAPHAILWPGPASPGAPFVRQSIGQRSAEPGQLVHKRRTAAALIPHLRPGAGWVDEAPLAQLRQPPGHVALILADAARDAGPVRRAVAQCQQHRRDAGRRPAAVGPARARAGPWPLGQPDRLDET